MQSNQVKDRIYQILQNRIDKGADYYGGIEPNYIPNQKRVRDILEGKIAMGAGGDIYDLNEYLGYGDDDNMYQQGGVVIGGMRPRRAPRGMGYGTKSGARKNPWIEFIKRFSAETGIPYNEVLKVPKYKRQAEAEYYGMGYGTKSGAKKAVATKRRRGELQSAARKAVMTKLERGEIQNAPSLGMGYGTKRGARKAVRTKRNRSELEAAALKAVRTKLRRGEIKNAPSLRRKRPAYGGGSPDYSQFNMDYFTS